LNDNRKNISTAFKKHKLGGAWWFSFEFLEENLDALDWLAARVSGVLVADTCAFKDEVQSAYNLIAN
jgi:hypothetical protein